VTKSIPSQPSQFVDAGNARRHALNPVLAGFSCIRCQLELAVGDYFEGCPSCLARGEPSTLRSTYSALPTALTDNQARGMQRYAAWMPYMSWVSLGEGGTSCTNFSSLAHELGVAAIHIKNEGQNPSGSHKDRMSCLAVTRARDVGATMIVAASSGNGGASLALYAAAAGLQCCIVTTPALSPVFRRAVIMTGAQIVTASDSLERWDRIAYMVKEQGAFPATNYLDPPVGSNHFGLDGLKTIAYEMFEELGPDLVDAVLVPTSRGDLVWGLFEGFRQIKAAGLTTAIPRLFAVEPFARISAVLGGETVTGSFPGTTKLTSIGGSTVTYQAIEAIRLSGGGAVIVADEMVARDQLRLARHGCYAELSSAAALTGLELLLKDEVISPDETVALIATSNGYKELASDERDR
jgi:threonine synthase